jgi:hypothetical protein
MFWANCCVPSTSVDAPEPCHNAEPAMLATDPSVGHVRGATTGGGGPGCKVAGIWAELMRTGSFDVDPIQFAPLIILLELTTVSDSIDFFFSDIRITEPVAAFESGKRPAI